MNKESKKRLPTLAGNLFNFVRKLPKQFNLSEELLCR